MFTMSEVSLKSYMELKGYKDFVLILCACATGLRYLVCVCICLSVCLSVTTLAATSFTFKQKIRYHRLVYGVFNSPISPKRLRSGDMAVLAFVSTIVAAFC